MSEIEKSPFDEEWHDDAGNLYPWGPQSGESGLAYHYFAVYLRLPLGKRSIAAVGRELGKDPHFLRELSAKNSWLDRAQAFDNHIDRKAIEEIVRGRTAMREEHLSIAEIAKGKLVARLKTMDPNEFSVRDTATWLDLVVKLERQARGEADKTLRVEGQIDVVDQLPTDQRRALMESARAVLNSRLGISEIEAYIEAEVIDDGGPVEES